MVRYVREHERVFSQPISRMLASVLYGKGAVFWFQIHYQLLKLEPDGQKAKFQDIFWVGHL